MTRPRSMPNRSASTTRPGTAYVMALTVCAVAATTAVSGLALRAASADRGMRVGDLAGARLLAQSGIEATLQRIEDDPNWRTTFGTQLIDTVTLGEGRFRIAVVDPADNDLTDSSSDGFRLISRGELGDSRATLSVDVVMVSDTYRERVIAEEPLRYWPLDETSGSTADDLMDNDNAGHSGSNTLNQITGFDGGPAPLYDSTFEYSWDMHHDDLLFSKGTVMCWVYCLGNVVGDQTIFSKTRDRGDRGEFVISITGDSLDLTATLVDIYGRKQTRTFGRISPNTWTHVTVAIGNKLECFVNGTQVLKDGSVEGGLTSNRDTITIGTLWTGLFPKNALNGSVRDVAIFDWVFNESKTTDLIYGEGTTLAIDPDSWAWVVD